MEVGLRSYGFYIPEKRVDAKELMKKAGLHEKVIQFMGINSVSEAEDNEFPSDMAIKASKNALERANINPLEIDFIINCPAGLQDYILPPVSGKIQYELQAENAVCYDLIQGCCGMLTGVNIAKNYILSGEANNVLVVSSDKWSAYTKYHCAEAVIFGDGAGAVIVSNKFENFKIIDFMFKTMGKYYDLYGIKEGGVKNINVENGIKYECMNVDVARNEFKNFYMPGFVEVIKKLLNKNKLKVSDIAYLSAVNANLRLLELICENLNFPIEKTSYDYLQKWGHIGGFDIFFNIARAFDEKKIKKGDKIILLNAGIGFTWGASLIEV